MDIINITVLPYLPLIYLAGIAALALVLIGIALRNGLRGWALRLLAIIMALLALLNPQLQQEERAEKTNIVFLAIDNSSSQQLDDRKAQTQAALQSLRDQFAQWPNFELAEVEFTQQSKGRDTGTQLLSALKAASDGVEPARIAGAILLSDGRIHDADAMREFAAPVHHLQTGQATDWDRRLALLNAPSFAIVDEEFSIKFRIDDQGNVPANLSNQVDLNVTIDGESVGTFTLPTNRDFEIPLTLRHGGQNIVQLEFAPTAEELTSRNNHAILTINGVRDRLQVLLVSGEPHAGARTWRNLLKSDPAVDLVHFTILRPPEKQGNVPVDELSLIAFPTHQLFVEKINEFDLIIADRYKRRGLVTQPYLQSIVEYIKQGGALLVSSGEYFAGAESLYRTPLGEILPAAPTGQVIERGFYPNVTDLGLRHPVTEGLIDEAQIDPDNPPWGRWYKLVATDAQRGDVVMSGADDDPLLVLDRVGQGRVAMLLSDQAWLWSRGADGGGPQQELLRRLAHWLMKEPELEEENLSSTVAGDTVSVTRRTLHDGVEPLNIKGPDGQAQEVVMSPVAPGQWQGEFTGAENGVYHLQQGDVRSIVAIGPTQPLEFSQIIATPDVLAPLRDVTAGGWIALSQTPQPELRIIRPDRPTYGDDWLGVVDRQAYDVIALNQAPLLPAWVYLLLAAVFAVAAWWVEGRSKTDLFRS